MAKITRIEPARTKILNLLKEHLSETHIWSDIEVNLALLCAELPEPSNDPLKTEFIEGIEKIKSYLLDNGIEPEKLEFINEEVKRLLDTKVISLYTEDEDNLDPELISAYARLSGKTEGVVGIKHPLNYKQLSKLTSGVWEKTGLIKFFISNERTFQGKIVAEIYEHPQSIPIAYLVSSKKKDMYSDEPAYRKIFTFGQYFNKHEVIIEREISAPFFVYRVISSQNKEYVMLSPVKKEIGDYIFTGVITECDDYKAVTESAKLPTKLPYFFAQEVRDRIIKFDNHDEFFERVNKLNLDKDKLFEYPFAIKIRHELWKTLHPLWYKKLIWAWLLHQPKGLFNNYPMHLFIVGPKQSGKSLLLNALHWKSKEATKIFSGSSSTMKHLIPSFKYHPARMGYLAETNRFAFCDEFLRCMVSNTTNENRREEAVALMNDLLEHQKREAGSGVSKVNLNMTSRVIATTNPVRGINNMTDMINRLDESFLSRWLIYFQTDDQIQLVRRSTDDSLERLDIQLDPNDWVSFLDYLHTFSAKYDKERLWEIYEEHKEVLSETLAKHYEARHKHHIECLIDGIVKTRCFLEKDKSFEANEQDYEDLKNIWSKIISSWLEVEKIKSLPIEKKIYYIPEDAQWLYWEIVRNTKDGSLTMEELNKIGLKELSRRRLVEAYTILKEQGMIREQDLTCYIQYYSKLKEEGFIK